MAELNTGGIAAEHGLTTLAADSPLAAPEPEEEPQSEADTKDAAEE